MRAQAVEEGVVYVLIGERHRVSVGEGDTLTLVEERAGGVLGQGEQLLVRDPQLAANGSVDILSELAAVDLRHPPIEHRLQAVVDQLRLRDAAPHALRRLEDAGSPRVDQMRSQRRAPLARLLLERRPQLVVRRCQVDAGDASCVCHVSSIVEAVGCRSLPASVSPSQVCFADSF